MDTKPTPQVLLKVPHNSVVATFQDPNKHSQKLVMLSFQNQTSSQTVTPTLSANSTLLSTPHCYSIRPTPSHLPNQSHTLPTKPALLLPPPKNIVCTSRKPTLYSCLTSSAVAPCTAHLHCANVKNWGTGPAEALLKTYHISDICSTAATFLVHGPMQLTQLTDMTLLPSGSSLMRPEVAKE